MNKRIERLTRELQRLPEGSLYLKRSSKYTAFVHYVGPGEVHNINQNLEFVYALARKKYIRLYIDVLKGTARNKLDSLLEIYAAAGLDIPRITLTKEQYAWTHENYKTNTFKPEEKTYRSLGGTMTRSKSEREIANQYDLLGIPMRYEAELLVDLSSLIAELELCTADYRRGRGLFHYSSGVCVWNVPPELSWMNMRGSLWRSFDSRTGMTRIFPDYSSLTYDNEIIYHEHEGVASNPFYRCTSSDRAFVMRETGTVSERNLITTFECDIEASGLIRDLLSAKVLPRI